MAVNYFRIKASDIRGNKWQLARISPTAQKYDFKFPMKALHTIANITMGQSPLGNTYNDKKQGLPFYQGKTLFSNKYILEPKTWTTDPKKIAYHNDILISVRAPVGSVNLCSLPEICIGRGLGAIRASKEANQEYLFYILLIFTNLIKGNHGATFEMIASDELANSLIPLPPMKIQQEIADIMDHAYTEKQRLESEAKELLNSIDSYVMDKLGIEQTQQITPTNKWFTVKASDIRGNRWDVKGYSTYPQQIIHNLQNSTYPYHVLNDFIINSFSGAWGEEISKISDEQKNDFSCVSVIRNTNFSNIYNINLSSVAERAIPKNIFKPTQEGDILVEKSGGSPAQPVGRVVLITKETANMGFSNFVHNLRLNQDLIYPYYIFSVLRMVYSLRFTEYFESQTTGIKNLLMSEFLQIPIPLPPMNIQQEIALECETRRNTAQQNQQLAQDILAKAKADVEKMLFVL